MSYTTITPTEAKPVANYKMATRMESGRLLYIAGQVSRDAEGEVHGKGDIRAQAQQVFQNVRDVLASCRRRPWRLAQNHHLYHQSRRFSGRGGGAQPLFHGHHASEHADRGEPSRPA